MACYSVPGKAECEVKSVYLLWYVHGEDELLIGVYETEDHAAAAEQTPDYVN